MSRLGEVWVFHDERSCESYIWLVVNETSGLDVLNLETGDRAIVESRVLDMIFHEDDIHWWERIA